MDDDEIAAALFSGEYDHLTVGEFVAQFPRDEGEPFGFTAEWVMVDYPVVDGIATLADGRVVASTAQVVQVPELRPPTLEISFRLPDSP